MITKLFTISKNDEMSFNKRCDGRVFRIQGWKRLLDTRKRLELYREIGIIGFRNTAYFICAIMGIVRIVYRDGGLN